MSLGYHASFFFEPDNREDPYWYFHFFFEPDSREDPYWYFHFLLIRTGKSYLQFTSHQAQNKKK